MFISEVTLALYFALHFLALPSNDVGLPGFVNICTEVVSMAYNHPIVSTSALALGAVGYYAKRRIEQHERNEQLLRVLLHIHCWPGLDLLKKGAVLRRLQDGADPNCSAELHYEWRPLHFFATLHYPDEVKQLIDYGAQIDVKSEFGSTPFKYALGARNDSVVKLLLCHVPSPEVQLILPDDLQNIFAQKCFIAVVNKQLAKAVALVDNYLKKNTVGPPLGIVLTEGDRYIKKQRDWLVSCSIATRTSEEPYIEVDRKSLEAYIKKDILQTLADK